MLFKQSQKNLICDMIRGCGLSPAQFYWQEKPGYGNNEECTRIVMSEATFYFDMETSGNVIAPLGLYIGSRMSAGTAFKFNAPGIDTANVTAPEEYIMPPGGIQDSKPEDTVRVEVSRILKETESSITTPWYGKTTTLPKSRISVMKQGGEFHISAPRSLLYEDGRPRYIEGHE